MDQGLSEPPPSLSFAYDPDPDLLVPLVERLGRFPRQHEPFWGTLRSVACGVAAWGLRAQFTLNVRGSLPDLPRFALAGNHQSHLDTLAVLAAVPRQVRNRMVVVAARDYFFTRLDRAIVASLVARAVAFDRTSPATLVTWTEQLRTVREGSLLVFPSGSRTRQAPRAGFLQALAAADWPIVPVALRGTAEAWPVGARVWRPFRALTVTFGEPLTRTAPRELAAQLQVFWESHAYA